LGPALGLLGIPSIIQSDILSMRKNMFQNRCFTHLTGSGQKENGILEAEVLEDGSDISINIHGTIMQS